MQVNGVFKKTISDSYDALKGDFPGRILEKLYFNNGCKAKFKY